MLAPRGPALALALLAALAPACARERPPEPDPASRRVLAQGAVVGFTSPEGAHVWRGLPYAAPPVGPLRWRAPRPPAPWSGEREALAFGAPCVQFAGPMGGRDGSAAGAVTGSEDCLVLDVYAPRFEPDAVPEGDARLPVMVWIHGGGNSIGDTRPYDGSTLATTRHVIVVAVQYRLGVFGWFAHPALALGGASPDDASPDFGTLDLVRALAWVRENAAAFGGDPWRVTVFGQSAGGANVYSLLLSPRAAGLFQRAIAESGGTRTVPLAEAVNYADAPEPGDARSAKEVVLDLLVAAGRAPDRAAARRVADALPDPELAAWLRSLPAADVLAAFDGSRLGGMYRSPRLIRDGRVLPAGDPLMLFRAGAYNRVPAVLGTNRDENKLFLLLGSDLVTRVAGVPLRVKDPRRYELEAEHASRLWKAAGADEPAAAMRASQGPSVFAYRFDWDDEPDLLWLDLGELLGAAHAVEIPFVFGNLSVGRATRFVFDPHHHAADAALAAAMTSYWSEFARTGDPGRGRDGALPEWTPWDPEPGGERFLVLDVPADGGLRMSGESLTVDGVIAGVDSDPRFASARERCAVYASFVGWTDRFDESAYAALDDGACAPYPVTSP